MQEKWADLGSKYKREHMILFPPFFYFSRFISDQARKKNDPSFDFTEPAQPVPSFSKYDNITAKHRDQQGTVSVRKTDIPIGTTSSTRQNVFALKERDPNSMCPIHKRPHPLKECRGFRTRTLQERRDTLKELGMCYKCCASANHIAKDCKAVIKCTECNNDRPVTAMHPTPSLDNPQNSIAFKPVANHGGELQAQDLTTTTVSSSCMEVCGKETGPKCCAKVCLVKVYPEGQSEKAIRMYAILDEQSNRSLAKPKFFELFNIKGKATPYTLNTFYGRLETFGRRATGFVVSCIKGNTHIPLPTLIECDQIPDEREEIPTPDAAHHHSHLRHLAKEIPPMGLNADILILLGRDTLRVHKVCQQCNGPDDAPYAQGLDLGWVIVGDVCLDKSHKPSEVNSYKTHVLHIGRTTHFITCSHHYEVKERLPNLI